MTSNSERKNIVVFETGDVYLFNVVNGKPSTWADSRDLSDQVPTYYQGPLFLRDVAPDLEELDNVWDLLYSYETEHVNVRDQIREFPGGRASVEEFASLLIRESITYDTLREVYDNPTDAMNEYLSDEHGIDVEGSAFLAEMVSVDYDEVEHQMGSDGHAILQGDQVVYTT